MSDEFSQHEDVPWLMTLEEWRRYKALTRRMLIGAIGLAFSVGLIIGWLTA